MRQVADLQAAATSAPATSQQVGIPPAEPDDSHIVFLLLLHLYCLNKFLILLLLLLQSSKPEHCGRKSMTISQFLIPLMSVSYTHLTLPTKRIV